MDESLLPNSLELTSPHEYGRMHTLDRMKGIKTGRRLSWMCATVFAAVYFITWALGVPAIHHDVVARVVSAWEDKVSPTSQFRNPVKPYCSFGVAFPVLPGVILSHHSYHLSPEGGASGWFMYLWYGAGNRLLIFRGEVS
jgi:hypothetical protein